MAFWSKKRSNKIYEYFDKRGITYQKEENDITRIKFDLCFKENNFILYPYLTIEEDNNLISFNVNVSSNNLKNYDLSIINDFNIKSNYFKAFITEKGIVVLEYRFFSSDDLFKILDELIESLVTLGNEIDNM